MKLLLEVTGGYQTIYLVDDDLGIKLIYSALFDITWLDNRGVEIDPNDIMDRNIYTEIKLGDLPEAALNQLTNFEYLRLKQDETI